VFLRKEGNQLRSGSEGGSPYQTLTLLYILTEF